MMKIWLTAAIFLIVILALWISQPFLMPQDKIVFLDIGQGDSILIQSGMEQVLIDGGSGAQVLPKLAEEMPWFDRKIDVIISTHPDKDHMGGLLEVVRRYNVGLLLLPPVPTSTQIQTVWLKELQSQVQAGKLQYRFAWRGDELNVGSHLKLRVVSPTQAIIDSLAGQTNDGSIVARADMDGLSVMLTGDLEMPVEKQLIANDPNHLLDVDVLKVGHHGSKYSTGSDWLAALSPGLAAISVGAKNSYGHPTAETLGRLADAHVRTLRTDLLGSIRLLDEHGKWLLSCEAKLCMK
jgi:competence protein ComEC